MIFFFNLIIWNIDIHTCLLDSTFMCPHLYIYKRIYQRSYNGKRWLWHQFDSILHSWSTQWFYLISIEFMSVSLYGICSCYHTRFNYAFSNINFTEELGNQQNIDEIETLCRNYCYRLHNKRLEVVTMVKMAADTWSINPFMSFYVAPLVLCF
jgi:hypothetical protein